MGKIIEDTILINIMLLLTIIACTIDRFCDSLLIQGIWQLFYTIILILGIYRYLSNRSSFQVSNILRTTWLILWRIVEFMTFNLILINIFFNSDKFFSENVQLFLYISMIVSYVLFTIGQIAILCKLKQTKVN